MYANTRTTLTFLKMGISRRWNVKTMVVSSAAFVFVKIVLLLILSG